MSNSVLTTPIGLAFPVTRTPQWKSRKPVAISGMETAISDWSFPRRTWEISFEMLRQSGSFAEMAAIEGFYNQRMGAVDTWLYNDPKDDSVTTQGIGIGDGVTSVFPLVRAFGGFVEPIFAPNLSVTPKVFLNGTLQSGTTYKMTPWGTGSHSISGFCNFHSNTSVSNVQIPASVNAVVGMIAYNATYIPFGSTITAIGESNLLISNSATATIANQGIILAGSGNLVFATPPSAGVVITATYSYYWPCRFVEDQYDFTQFDSINYSMKKLTFQSVKV